MSVSLAGIDRIDAKNTPGYSELYAMYEKEIDTLPAHSNFAITAPITMVATKRMWKIEFDAESGAFCTTAEESAEGAYGQHTYTLTVHIAGDNAALKNQLDKFCGVPCVFLGRRKSDGVLEVIGEKGRGIVLKSTKLDQPRSGGRKGYDLVGVLDYNHLPYDYTDGTLDLTA
jgi:hypothetical protein